MHRSVEAHPLGYRVCEPRFGDLLAGMLNERQQQRVFESLAPIVQ